MGLILFATGIGRYLAYHAIWAIVWTGLTIAIILLLISYSFPKETQIHITHFNYKELFWFVGSAPIQ
ncbi:hypothetical protein SAMN04244570_0952 [Sporosarcina newyorkensis]|uniref:Uncharacterized protein n=1 Tax=Sporosarcina newyorkensis TaxID=759851 RepID=A0A1T4XL81_9BACL|nr:hypothetical protein SAMN04244570_0952 [Sporosarcina newyorkensis]